MGGTAHVYLAHAHTAPPTLHVLFNSICSVKVRNYLTNEKLFVGYYLKYNTPPSETNLTWFMD